MIPIFLNKLPMLYLKFTVQQLIVVQQADGTLDRCIGGGFASKLHHVIF